MSKCEIDTWKWVDMISADSTGKFGTDNNAFFDRQKQLGI